MDPNATLEILRATVAEFRKNYDDPSKQGEAAKDELIDLGDTLAEACDALDQWMSKGGFKPTVWDEEHATPDYDPTCAPCQFGECTGH